MKPAVDDKGVFTEEEEALLASNQGLRKEIIRSMIEGGVPKDSRQVRLLMEVLNSTDEGINRTANTRLRKKEVDVAERSVDRAADVLRNIRFGVGAVGATYEKAVDVDIEIPDDIKNGELDIEPDALELKDFLNFEKKEDI